jgi:hypothetical protein
MRERAQLIGGRLDAAAADGVFTVEASLPTGAASENPDPLERSVR